MFRSPFAARGILAGTPSLAASAPTATILPAASRFARRSMLVAASALTLVGALSLPPASASAASIDTFTCTNTTQSSTAPSGAVSARVTLNGAGGKASASGVPGGTGEGMAVTMPVIPGQQFDVYVGCQDGYGGGGRGGGESAFNYSVPIAGGSGGGASYVVPAGGAFSEAYAVAPGGGGGGDAGLDSSGSTNGGGPGGSATPPAPGDGASAQNITDYCCDSVGGGHGGLQNGAGGAGGHSSNFPADGAGGGAGSSGAGGAGGLAVSGPGPFAGNFTGGAGGGGGGGWQGGGGGGAGGVMVDSQCCTPEEKSSGGGGGAAGSEYVASGVSLVSNSGSIAGDGSVSITYSVTGTTAPPPPTNGTSGTSGKNGTPGATGPQGPPGSFKPGRVTLSGVSLSAHTLTSCSECALAEVTLAFRVSRLSVVHLTLERLTAHGWLLVGTRSLAELGGGHLIQVGQSFAKAWSAGRYRLLVMAANGHAHSPAFVERLQVRAPRGRDV